MRRGMLSPAGLRCDGRSGGSEAVRKEQWITESVTARRCNHDVSGRDGASPAAPRCLIPTRGIREDEMNFEELFRYPPSRLAAEAAGSCCEARRRGLDVAIPDDVLKNHTPLATGAKPAGAGWTWRYRMMFSKIIRQ